MKRWKRLAAGVALCLPLAVPAQAQPADTLKIVVPFAASGPTDMIARIIAVPFGELVGRKVACSSR